MCMARACFEVLQKPGFHCGVDPAGHRTLIPPQPASDGCLLYALGINARGTLYGIDNVDNLFRDSRLQPLTKYVCQDVMNRTVIFMDGGNDPAPLILLT